MEAAKSRALTLVDLIKFSVPIAIAVALFRTGFWWLPFLFALLYSAARMFQQYRRREPLVLFDLILNLGAPSAMLVFGALFGQLTGLIAFAIVWCVVLARTRWTTVQVLPR